MTFITGQPIVAVMADLRQRGVVFADYDIPAPSLGTVTTEDNGLLEFVLLLERR